MTEFANVPEDDKNKVFASARHLLVVRQREIFDEEIAEDTGLLVSDVRAALSTLDGNGLTITPREDGSINVGSAEG